jgi:uncharacterized protein
MRVAVTGSRGFVGTALTRALERRGDEVVAVRRGSGKLAWDPMRGFDPPDALSGVDAVVHLAGENVGQRWTRATKRAIRESRVIGTTTLVDGLAAATPRPSVFVSASAIGIYGARGDERLLEEASPGDDFLGGVCREWEAAALRAETFGVRTAVLRFGPILGHGGGPLPRLLPFFRAGLGGRLGSGKQWMSWIHLEDLVRAIVFCLETPEIAGVFNTTAPEPVTNAEFTRALGEVLRRPTVVPVPGFAVRAVYGEMAETVLTGQRAVPDKLEAAGFGFRHRTVTEALTDLLDRTGDSA